VQQPPPVRDLLLLVLEIVDERLELLVGQGCEIGQRFHQGLSVEVVS
jgi:hypothetical protein